MAMAAAVRHPVLVEASPQDRIWAIRLASLVIFGFYWNDL